MHYCAHSIYLSQIAIGDSTGVVTIFEMKKGDSHVRLCIVAVYVE